MIGIYKITNLKGRVYVGQSLQIERRRRSYSRLDCKRQVRLYSSLVKYGLKSHTFEIIEECATDQLNEKERYWQDYYDVVGPNGLNCKLTDTDDKSGKHSQHTIKKRSKPVLQYTTKGMLIEEWQSGTQAGETLHISRSAISACCRGQINSAGGFIWKYRTDCLEELSPSLGVHKHCKQVLQYTKEGILVREWQSITEAGTHLGSMANISNCVRGVSKSAHGFIWKYK